MWTADVESFSEMVERASMIACQERIGAPGQSLIVTAGVPFGTPGATNSLRVITIAPDGQQTAPATAQPAFEPA